MRQHVAVYLFCCVFFFVWNLQSYPAVLVLASKQDSIIPFEGVQKYVSKLKLCVQQHWSNTGQELSTKQTWMSLLSTNTSVFTESPIPRGTVLFHIDKHHNHHGSGENTQTLKEVVNLLPYEMVRIIATVKNLAIPSWHLYTGDAVACCLTAAIMRLWLQCATNWGQYITLSSVGFK